MTRLTHTRKRSAPDRGVSRAFVATLVSVLAMALFGLGVVDAAEDSDVEIRLKAAFIYNFARFVDWPTHSVSGPFRIGILGQGLLESPLKQLVQGKTASGRPLEITVLKSMADADHCEILLIERSEAGHIKEIVQAIAGKPVLTVCNGSPCARDGGMIAFQIVDDSVRFQINQESALRAGLKLSSQLLKVAIPASGKRQ